MTPLMWRIINLMLLLAWGMAIVILLLLNFRLLRSLSSLWRSLRNLTLHSWLVVPLVNFLTKFFLLIAPISIAIGNDLTRFLKGTLRLKSLFFTLLLLKALSFGVLFVLILSWSLFFLVTLTVCRV